MIRNMLLRAVLLCGCGVLFAFATGCAGKYARAVEDIQTVDEAQRRFGPADAVTELENGMLRHEWSRRIDYDYSGGGDNGSYGVSVGGGTGSFGIFLSQWIFGNASYGGAQECRLVIVGDADGRVAQKSSTGNACDKLMPMREEN